MGVGGVGIGGLGDVNQTIQSIVGLNSIYSVIIDTIVNIYTMSCETGSDSKHKAYI